MLCGIRVLIIHQDLEHNRSTFPPTEDKNPFYQDPYFDIFFAVVSAATAQNVILFSFANGSPTQFACRKIKREPLLDLISRRIPFSESMLLIISLKSLSLLTALRSAS